MGEEKEKMKTGKKVIIALIIILLIFTAAAYGYGVHYFTDHFLPGSQVNGFNCSYKTADETEQRKREHYRKRSRFGLQTGWRSQETDQKAGPL